MKHLHVALAGFFVLALTAAATAAGEDKDRYDLSKPVTVEGSILTSTFEDPNTTIAVKTSDKIWTVTMAPVSKMVERGVKADFVAVGKTVSASGYQSKIEMNEMRAERITIDGKTYELR